MRGSNEIDSFGRRILVTNWVKRKGNEDPLPPEFVNTAICIACGKEKHVNTSGFCQLCWVQFSHLRKNEYKPDIKVNLMNGKIEGKK